MDGLPRENNSCQVAVLISSRLRIPFVPLNEATIFSLYPDYRRYTQRSPGQKSDRPYPFYRLAKIKLRLDRERQLLVGKCTKFWELGALVDGHASIRWSVAREAADQLSRAIQQQPPYSTT